MINLLAFIAVQAAGGGETLLYWPFIVLALGLGTMAAGLRPRSPLPPEPDAYHRGSVPLAARTDDELVVRVRDDAPPRP